MLKLSSSTCSPKSSNETSNALKLTQPPLSSVGSNSIVVTPVRKSNFRPKEAGKAAHRSSARAEIEGAQRGRLLGSPTPPPKVAAAPFLMPWHQERTLNRAKSPVDPHEPSQRPHAAAGKKDAKTRVRARFFQRAERVERTRGRDP